MISAGSTVVNRKHTITKAKVLEVSKTRRAIKVRIIQPNNLEGVEYWADMGDWREQQSCS